MVRDLMSRISLSDPFNRRLFRTYCVSGTVGGTGAILVNTQQPQSSHSRGSHAHDKPVKFTSGSEEGFKEKWSKGMETE